MGKYPVKQLEEIQEIIAGDACYLREIFHPDRDDVDINFSLAYAYILPGGRTIDHFMEQSETYFILFGTGRMHMGEDTFEVKPGTTYVVPPRVHQWIENSGLEKLEFLVTVAPPWRKEDEVVCE